MKYIYLISILLCLSYQSKEQVIANNSTIDSITTANKVSTNKEGGVVKAQDGSTFIYDEDAEINAMREHYQRQNAEKQQAEAIASGKTKEQAVIFTIGIVILFIVITIITFCILYTKRNKDNPYINQH